MKRIGLFLICLLCVPYIARAADHCTNPDEYTVDKRCYVTDEQKKEKPYNAVAGLYDDNGIFCTGTIVKKDDELYLYTAKHCTDRDNDNVPDETLKMKLQNDNTFDVTFVECGNYDIKTKKHESGDWAVYSINERDLPFVKISDLAKTFIVSQKFDAKRIGYGVLKIMSDKDIEDFKQKYITWLEEEQGVNLNRWNESHYGIIDGGVSTRSSYGIAFKTQLESEYYLDLFDDERLKVSECKYSTKGNEIGCQGWNGDSGGGIFNANDYLIGIHTMGTGVIGGDLHGKSIGSVILLENILKKL